MKKILIITPYIPYPIDSGGNQAVFTMIDNLRKHYSVSLLLAAKKSNGNVTALKKIWTDINFYIYDKMNAESGSIPLKLKMLTYFADSFCRKYNRYFYKALPKRYGTDSLLRRRTLLNMKHVNLDQDYCRYVNRIANLGFDIIQTEFYDLLELCYFLPQNVTKVFVHHEIGFVRRKNELDLLQAPTCADFAAYHQHKDMEIAMLKRFDHIITLTENDKKILSGYITEDRIHVSPAIVNSSDAMDFTECGHEFVFIGSQSHFPNNDAVNWLCEKILPELRFKMEYFKIYIVGNWGKKIKRRILKQNREVIFTDYIKNLGQFLNGKISIIPIRIGSGMRMKILDAIWACSPFITTSKGVEGQNFVNGVDCITADTPESFSEAMTMLSEDIDLQKKIAMNAMKDIKDAYAPEKMTKQREDIYEKILNKQISGLDAQKTNGLMSDFS